MLSSIAALAIVIVPPAAANPYETFIDVETEEDLYDLAAMGQIDDETLAELVEVFQRGVDLNRATREELYALPNLTYAEVDAILEYRELTGWIKDPIDLIVGGALSQEKLEAIAGFLIVTDPTRSRFSTDGWIAAQTRWTVEDEDAPPMALRARVTTLRNLTVGFASTFSRNRLADVEYDPNRDALTASAQDRHIDVPKFYAKWETDRWGIIAGTYRIGFGQRLTFDNTSLYTPNGFYRDDQLFRDSYLVRECRESSSEEVDESPCTGAAGDIYETPDYGWREGLLGAAVGLKKLELGNAGHLQSYGFASYQRHSLYQYEVFNPATCDDPRDDDDDDCRAPDVYVRRDDPMEPTTRFSFSTLPNLYAESTAGGNIAYVANRRTHIGVTGYGSDVSWLPDMPLDFQEWSRLPYGGPFGAIGADASYGISMFDFMGEVTRSFDSMTLGNDGLGALLRWVTTFKKQNELETSVRYYDQNFKNPYARPIAAVDEFEGVRARDEMGARLRYTARLDKRLSVRSTADMWRTPSDDTTDLLLSARSDLDLTDQYRVGVWGMYKNKDVSLNGGGQCFDVTIEVEGETVPCAGEKYLALARLRWAPTSRYAVTGQYQHEWGSDMRYPDEMRQDLSASLIGTARPIDRLRLRARVRYLSEDISDNTYLEQSVWGYLTTSLRLRDRDWLRVRYDVYVYLDERESTQERVPSPEHWLWLEYQSRF
jgi:hypothetical protein